MADQRKDKSVMGLVWLVHLVCCGLLLVFLLGGISVDAITSYLQDSQDSLVPLGVALVVVGIAWAGDRMWRGSTLHWN